MKNNNGISFMIVAGIFIVIVFAFIAIYNIMPSNKESNSYYAKVEEGCNAKIEKLEIGVDNLMITTSGDTKEYCVKTTRSTPSIDSICFKSIENNYAKVKIYKYKKYYIWVKDSNNNISEYTSINS